MTQRFEYHLGIRIEIDSGEWWSLWNPIETKKIVVGNDIWRRRIDVILYYCTVVVMTLYCHLNLTVMSS